MLADPAVDVVAICTRHADHAALAQEALAAGKHVFCEKPLALDRDELQAVMAAEADSPGVLAVGFNRRFSPLMREAREFLGESGPVTLTYRVSAGQLPEEHWTHDLEQGGGRLLGEGCHFIDCALFLFGAPIVEVRAIGHGGPATARRAHDNLIVDLVAANGSVGTIVYSAGGASKLAKERLEAFAGSRTAILDDYRSVELLDGTKRRNTRAKGQDKGHRAEVAAFVEGVRRGESPVPREEVLNTSLATLAAAESLEHGAPVRLQP